MLKIGVLALLKNAVPLSTIRVTIPAILYTFIKVAFGTYNLSPSSFEKFSTVENLFKYSEIFKGRAATKGQVLGSIPNNSKFIEIIGLNYADDNNFYYFTPIILRTEIIRNRDIAFTVGITSDTREFVLSFKNNVITITHSAVINSTADNNFIAQILSVNP